MCTVKQLKEWLEQFPEDTKVEVLEEYTRNWDTQVRHVPLDLSDYRDNWDYHGGLGILYLGDH
jgi:hypothetical protein